MKRIALSVLFISISAMMLNAQAPLKKSLSKNTSALYSAFNFNSNSHKAFSIKESRTLKTDLIFPESFRNNPQDFHWLCQKELEIERKLPVGIWMKFGDEEGMKDFSSQQSYIRLRWFLK